MKKSVFLAVIIGFAGCSFQNVQSNDTVKAGNFVVGSTFIISTTAAITSVLSGNLWILNEIVPKMLQGNHTFLMGKCMTLGIFASGITISLIESPKMRNIFSKEDIKNLEWINVATFAMALGLIIGSGVSIVGFSANTK